METMHLLLSVAIQPNLELKNRPKQLLGFLLLVIVLPGLPFSMLWRPMVFVMGSSPCLPGSGAAAASSSLPSSACSPCARTTGPGAFGN
jgi:hypothetical protein